MHRSYELQFSTANTESPENAEGIAAGLQTAVDEAVADTMARDKNAPDVKCRRGCSACCRLHVVVTAGEAKLARLAAEDIGWEIDVERARVQAQANTADEWRHLSDADRACVFLTSAGECAIYEYRPMACRKYMVISPPEDCDSILKPGHQVLFLVAPQAEVVFAASLTVFEAGTLAAMLLQEIER